MPTLTFRLPSSMGSMAKLGECPSRISWIPIYSRISHKETGLRCDFCDRHTLEYRRNAPIKLSAFPTTGTANPLQLLNGHRAR